LIRISVKVYFTIK